MGGGAHGRSRRLLYRRARLRGGGRRIGGRRLGDVVVNQIRGRLDMMVRGWLSERLLLASQERGFDDRLAAGPTRLPDGLPRLKVAATPRRRPKPLPPTAPDPLCKMNDPPLKT